MSRALSKLEPGTLNKVAELLRLCSARGLSILVFSTLRTPKEQAHLYSKGRDGNGKRIPGQSVSTNAKPWRSWHNYGRAVDVVPWQHYVANDVVSKRLDWTPFPSVEAEREFRRTHNTRLLSPEWKILVEKAEEVGLEWGGLWSRLRDYVHFQHRAGMTLDQAYKREGPKTPKA